MKDKKIMVIVPHEDDELNLIGGLLRLKEINKKNCYIVYMTNGDFDFLAKTRIKEALKSTKYLKIPRENVIFLGYADQCFYGNNHIYNTHKPDKFTSKKGKTNTYCEIKDEFSYKKNKQHNPYNYESLLNDFISLLDEYQPDILFTNDFDSHPDHRCCSLIFDKALGIVLKNNLNYQPKVYKGFAYPTAYKGVNDFNNINLESTKFKTEDHSFCKMQNPYYKWEERVRFPVYKNNKLLLFNKLYQNLKKHRSQLIIKRCYSIINNDQVFFERHTNNLALKSNITVSSGKKEFLNDFVLFDCDDILNGDKQIPKLLDEAWIPDIDDEKKTIKFEFEKNEDIDKICLYQNVNSKQFIKKIIVTLSNGLKKEYDLFDDYKTEILINQKNINWLSIKIKDEKTINQGFSEIEILKENKNTKQFIKILNNDDFVYDKYIYDRLNINIYYYDGFKSNYLKKEDCVFYLNNKEISYIDINKITLKKFDLKVKLKDSDLFDEVKFKRINTFYKIIHKIIVILNDSTLWIEVFFSRVINKIKRITNNL